MSLQLPSFAEPDTEAERIASRRAKSQSRAARFLDSRARTMGVDVAYLKQQVEERKALARAERETDLQRAADERAIIDAVEQADAEDDADRRARDIATASVWEAQLDRSVRPEADLVPEFNPAQAVDVDACGPSAAQRFAGEGSGLVALRRTQAQQQKSWLDEQMLERRAARQKAEEEEAAFDAGLSETIAARGDAETEEHSERLATNIAVQAANKDLAAAARERASAEAAAMASLAAAENEAQTSSAFLCETSEVVGPSGRVRRDMFKGLGRQVVGDMLRSNTALVADARARAAAEEAEDKELLDTLSLAADAAREDEEEDAVRTLQMRMTLKEHHAMQVAEARAREAQNKAAATGSIDGAYFAPFGKSDR